MTAIRRVANFRPRPRNNMKTPTALVFALLLFSAPVFARPKVVAYVPNWIELKTFAETIDYAKVKHINIAFENPRNDAGDMSFNPKDVPLIARARTNGVKILVSIGGGAASGDKAMLNRYFHLLNETNRAGFASRLADYVVTNQFDGLDVDLEGPSINQDYGAFIDDLARALKPKG